MKSTDKLYNFSLTSMFLLPPKKYKMTKSFIMMYNINKAIID